MTLPDEIDRQRTLEVLRHAHERAVEELSAAISRDSPVGAREWAQAACETACAIRETILARRVSGDEDGAS